MAGNSSSAATGMVMPMASPTPKLPAPTTASATAPQASRAVGCAPRAISTPARQRTSSIAVQAMTMPWQANQLSEPALRGEVPHAVAHRNARTGLPVQARTTQKRSATLARWVASMTAKNGSGRVPPARSSARKTRFRNQLRCPP